MSSKTGSLTSPGVSPQDKYVRPWAILWPMTPPPLTWPAVGWRRAEVVVGRCSFRVRVTVNYNYNPHQTSPAREMGAFLNPGFSRDYQVRSQLAIFVFAVQYGIWPRIISPQYGRFHVNWVQNSCSDSKTSILACIYGKSKDVPVTFSRVEHFCSRTHPPTFLSLPLLATLNPNPNRCDSDNYHR